MQAPACCKQPQEPVLLLKSAGWNPGAASMAPAVLSDFQEAAQFEGAGVVGAGVVGAVSVPVPVPAGGVVELGHRKRASRMTTMTTMMPMMAFLLMGSSPHETIGGTIMADCGESVD